MTLGSLRGLITLAIGQSQNRLHARQAHQHQRMAAALGQCLDPFDQGPVGVQAGGNLAIEPDHGILRHPQRIGAAMQRGVGIVQILQRSIDLTALQLQPGATHLRLGDKKRRALLNAKLMSLVQCVQRLIQAPGAGQDRTQHQQ